MQFFLNVTSQHFHAVLAFILTTGLLIGNVYAQEEGGVDPAFAESANLILDKVHAVLKDKGFKHLQLAYVPVKANAGEASPVSAVADSENRIAVSVLTLFHDLAVARAPQNGWMPAIYDAKSPDPVKSGDKVPSLLFQGIFKQETGEIAVAWGLKLPGQLEVKGTNAVGLNLSTAAYSGAFSFEARRWVADAETHGGYKLSNVDLPVDREIFRGIDSEAEDFAVLNPARPYPLAKPDFPYNVEIVVEKTPRVPQLIDGQAYVAVEDGEKFNVLLSNNSPRFSLVALYIDGVNSINPSIKPPHLTPAHENWFLGPSLKGVIEGWSTPRYGAPVGGGDSERRFVVSSDLSKTVAMNLANTNKQPTGNTIDLAGTITAVFYAFETVQTPLLPAGRGGTAAGELISKKYSYDQSGRKKDVILAAVSLHYRPAAEIEKLKTSANKQQFDLVGTQLIKTLPSKPPELQVSEAKAFPR